MIHRPYAEHKLSVASPSLWSSDDAATAPPNRGFPAKDDLADRVTPLTQRDAVRVCSGVHFVPQRA